MKRWLPICLVFAEVLGAGLLPASAAPVTAPMSATAVPHPTFTEQELATIGKKVWQNECGGRRDGLTSWNAGEQFASLGIGHFIWYPQGTTGPFDEAFPRLAAFLAAEGAPVPEWVLDHPCPWSSRAEFQAAFRTARMNELRALLADTVPLQARFLAQRMEESLPKLLEAAPTEQQEKVRAQFQRMLGSGSGTFALIDYVNFKGEGIKETERYRGAGWGLLQVLQGMKGTGSRGAVQEFAASAEHVLARRVRNSPAARGEKRWLVGWTNRVRRYVQ